VARILGAALALPAVTGWPGSIRGLADVVTARLTWLKITLLTQTHLIIGVFVVVVVLESNPLRRHRTPESYLAARPSRLSPNAGGPAIGAEQNLSPLARSLQVRSNIIENIEQARSSGYRSIILTIDSGSSGNQRAANV
jgi:hypothetical protein